MKSLLLFSLSWLVTFASAQNLPDSCKLLIGTNLGGLADYGTELPFVDVMHNCRTWYTKDVGNPNGSPFNTEHAAELSYRPDGYPTEVPQSIAGSAFPQKISTIWAYTSGWTPGTYTVLFEGTGTLSFWGGYANLQYSSPNRITFDFNNPLDNILEMTIETSEASDPVRNIRVLMPGSENTYETQPFNPVWLEKLLLFKSVRFMDWFATNAWGQQSWWDWDHPELFEWSERQQMDHYTWADNKGIPYEMAIKLLNDYDLDGWVCVPHRANNDFIQKMAEMFHNQLEPARKLTLEYSNETWNWGFGQAQWLNKYGCLNQGIPWPEGTVPYIQNCLDIWTNVYGSDLNRLQRVVGVQTAWQDVANRTVFNMEPGSLDAFAVTYYFGLNTEADAVLDSLGASATSADIAYWARISREETKNWLHNQQEQISIPLGLPMVFYEGGQHLTPQPFGTEPTYAQALLDIQRDTAIYNLYNEMYDFLRTLQSGSQPLHLMNFSFVSSRSARYGSWGILETMNQDLSQIPAPKFQATLENNAHCISVSASAVPEDLADLVVFPNPGCRFVQLNYPVDQAAHLQLLRNDGSLVLERNLAGTHAAELDLSGELPGVFWVLLQTKDGRRASYKIIKQ